jgi:hypothetical protein
MGGCLYLIHSAHLSPQIFDQMALMAQREQNSMSVITHMRQATTDEIAAEMDRRGEVIQRLEARIGSLETALRLAESAIAEFYRYWHGGEMRGSYDGRPERESLWKALYATRAALAQSAAPVAPEDPYWKGAYERMADRNVVLSEAVKSAILVLDDLATGQGIDIPIEQIIRDLNAVAHTGGAPASPDDPYDRGRRDILNALLAPNPAIAAKIAKWAEPPHDPDPEGRLPFDVALWITEVAEQLGIKSLEELGEASPVQQAAPSGEEG